MLSGNKSDSAFRGTQTKIQSNHHICICYTRFISKGDSFFFFSALSFSLKNKTVLILVLHVISFSSIVVQISATIMLAPMYETMEPSQLALLRMHFILQTILTTLPIQVFQVCVPGPRNFICI